MTTFLVALAQRGGDDGGSPLFGLIGLIIAVIVLAAEWKVYTKAGKPGWAIIIPIYNVIVLLQIAGKPWWWLLLFFVPFVNIIVMVMAMHSLSKSFGHGIGFTLGLIFLSPIFLLILGFGDSRYVGPGGEPTLRPAMA